MVLLIHRQKVLHCNCLSYFKTVLWHGLYKVDFKKPQFISWSETCAMWLWASHSKSLNPPFLNSRFGIIKPALCSSESCYKYQRDNSCKNFDNHPQIKERGKKSKPIDLLSLNSYTAHIYRDLWFWWSCTERIAPHAFPFNPRPWRSWYCGEYWHRSELSETRWVMGHKSLPMNNFPKSYTYTVKKRIMH